MELNSPLTVRSSKFIVLQTLQTVAQEGKSLTGYFIFFFSLKKKKNSPFILSKGEGSSDHYTVVY